METYKNYQHNSYKKLVRNHIYVKLEQILKDKIPDPKERQKLRDDIYKLFEEMV